MENAENITQVWEVEAGGRLFEAKLEDMREWIAEGSLLRIDRVRKGNLRWIEAGKVPQLVDFFNAKDAGEPMPPTITATHVELLGVTPPAKDFGNDSPVEEERRAVEDVPVGVGTDGGQPSTSAASTCAMHPDIEAAYACDTCANSFCKSCPTGYGATVKICPFCGAMCRSLAAPVVEARNYQQQTRAIASEGFGFGDFGNALAYPFKFKFSLIVGAVMFGFFSLGSGAGGFGGMFAMVGGIVCMMCANMLSFGVLANTVENFSQGKLNSNFMPSFDDFSIWDDVVHPFFLSIGVYVSSFGPFLAVVLLAMFMIANSVGGELNGMKEDAARAVNPELPYAAKAANQSQAVKDLVQKTKNDQQKRVEQLEKSSIDGDDLPAAPAAQPGVDPDQEEFDHVQQMIQENRKAQLESVVGKTPETEAKEQQALIKKIFGYGLLFLLLGGVTLLWGLFYFPAACAVAGYTQSFAATVNPTVGLDTIKRLGGTYALVVVMALVLLIISSAVSGVLSVAFGVFVLPGLGNLPAKFLGSMFGFYITVVFSCVLGYALFKKADQLDLPS